MMKKEKPMMSVTAIIQGAQTQHWGRTLAGFGGPHTPLGYPCTNGLTLNQNLSMGPMGPQSPIEMKPDASTLGQFSPQGPNSPGSFTLGSTNLLGGQKGATSPYPPNHPLSGSKHLCSICGDRASGKHYGVYSCEGCKGFFKRTVRKDLSYACREEKNCIIDKRQRNRCQYCRYQKCLSMGMKREAVQEERQRTKDRETAEVESTSNMQCEISIEKLIEAEKRVECTEPLVSLEGDLMTIGQATNKQVLQLVEWSKLIPHFTSLPLTDQVLLLKNGWNDLLIATIAHRSIGSDQGIVLSTGLTVTSTTAHAAGLGTIYDRILNEIVAKLKEKRVDKVELICLKAITLLNCNIRGLKSRKEVEMLRIRVYEVFEEYTKATYPNESGRFDKLMLRLPPLRSVSLKCVEPLFLFGLIGDVSIETFLTDMLQNPADI